MRKGMVLLMLTLTATMLVAQTPQPITNWLVCGPFPFRRELQEFFVDHLTQHGGETKIVPKEDMSHSIRDLGEVQWQRHTTSDGFIDFAGLFAKGEEARPRYWKIRYGLAYANAEIKSQKPQRALLLIGSEDWCAVWLNGELVHEGFVYRHCVPDKDAVLVNLRKGTNRLLIKVARIAGGWGASVKIIMPLTRKLFVKTERYGCPPDGNAFVPEIRDGETLPVWGYVTVINTAAKPVSFVRAKVRENDWFSVAEEQIGELASGESSQLPFVIVPKRPLSPDETPRLELVVETVGERQEFSLPITVRRRNEPFFTTHRSKLDGSVQPMTLLVPPNYNASHAYPLIVALHGAKGCLIGHAFSVKSDFIIVAPHGRGQTGYREFGEGDVFEAIDEVRRRYRIDDDRIYLTGHSMGGGGTFRLAVRHPHRWAAIVPMASAGARPLEWLQNLLHVPTLFYQGGEDEVVPVTMAREAAERLKQLGYNFSYIEEQGKPHWWGVDFPKMFAFFAQHRLVKAPERIVFWTNDARANRSYWLEIADFDEDAKPARLEAQLARDNGQVARVILKTENVAEVTLHLNDVPDALRRLPLVVEWNGCQAIVTQWTTPKTLTLRLQSPLIGMKVNEELWQWQRDGSTVFVNRIEPSELKRKTPKRFGPVMDVFNAPFFVIYESESDGAKWAAQQLKRWWQNHALGICRVKEFKGSLEELLSSGFAAFGKGYNLIMFKRAKEGEENGVVTFESNAVRIGKKRFEGKTVSIRFVMPNPFHPQRYLLINAGVSDEALHILSRVPMDIGQPYDYLVADERFLREGIKGLLTVGRFNNELQVGR